MTTSEVCKEYNDIKELMQVLEKMKSEGRGTLGIPKALYCILKEIKKINLRLKKLEVLNDNTRHTQDARTHDCGS